MFCIFMSYSASYCCHYKFMVHGMNE
jgi:hypothetical protein